MNRANIALSVEKYGIIVKKFYSLAATLFQEQNFTNIFNTNNAGIELGYKNYFVAVRQCRVNIAYVL